jgi:hypothetical protein
MSAGTTGRVVAVSALRVPEAFRVLGEESVRNGTDKLTSRQISRIIKGARSRKK